MSGCALHVHVKSITMWSSDNDPIDILWAPSVSAQSPRRRGPFQFRQSLQQPSRYSHLRASLVGLHDDPKHLVDRILELLLDALIGQPLENLSRVADDVGDLVPAVVHNPT